MLWLKRLRLYQDKRTLAFVGIVFLITISAGIYMAATPATYDVTETIEKNTYSTEYTHYSVSERSSELFDEGEKVVQPNRYFIYNHLNVHMIYTPKLNGQEMDSSKYSSKYSVYITSQTPTTDEIIYRKSITESQIDIVELSGNELTIDIEEFQNHREELRQELPRGSRIVLNIDRTTDVPKEDGSSVKMKSTADIYFSDVRTYIVEVESEPIENRQTRTIQRPQPSRTLTVMNYPLDTTGLLIVGLSLGVLIILLYLIYVQIYIEKDQEELRFEYEVDKYGSWITTGHPYQDPTFQDDTDIIQVDSIKGLVDIAVDNATRVVHTKDAGRFYVYDEHAIYTYTKPGQDNMGFFLGPNENIPNFDSAMDPFGGTSPTDSGGRDADEANVEDMLQDEDEDRGGQNSDVFSGRSSSESSSEDSSGSDGSEDNGDEMGEDSKISADSDKDEKSGENEESNDSEWSDDPFGGRK